MAAEGSQGLAQRLAEVLREASTRRAIALADEGARICARTAPPGTDAQEVESAAYEAAWRAVESFDPNRGCSFDTWCRRKIGWALAEVRRDYGRRRSARYRAFRDNTTSIHDPRAAHGRLAEQIPDPGQPLQDLFAQDEMARALERALEVLPENERRVVVEHHWGQKSYSEIAREMGRTRRRVVQLHRNALERLREHEAVLGLAQP